MDPPQPTRAPWESFPDVVIHTGESAVKKHRSYAAAKLGDVGAAFDLVQETVSANAVQTLRAQLGTSAPLLWLPVIAEEAFGVNRIPLAVAEALAARLGGEVVVTIAQCNTVGHTGASGWHRLSFPALFRGTARQDGCYVLVDDFVGQGGTLANLRGFVMANGGRVAMATALTGQSRSAGLRLSLETLTALESKHGHALETLWQDWFGYGLDRLTDSEARYLLRAEDPDAVRVRLVAARRGADAG